LKYGFDFRFRSPSIRRRFETDQPRLICRDPAAGPSAGYQSTTVLCLFSTLT